MAETSLHQGKGRFLVCATLEGNSTLSLEQAISKYSGQGKYSLEYGRIQRNPERDFVIGVFKKPTVGCLRVSHFHSAESPNYAISGESYGQGIVSVMLDYAELIGLESVTSPKSEDFFRGVRQGLAMEEAMLSLVPDKNTRKQFYLELLQGTRGCVTPEIPISEEPAETYAKKHGIDLSRYERHFVIFRFPTNLDSLITDIQYQLAVGLMASAPNGTLAMVKYEFHVEPGKSDSEFINTAQAIALVRK